jgi:predicted NBD/HSP70 family sugar kinase
MKNAIGIDLGGTSIKYALVDEQGSVHFEKQSHQMVIYQKMPLFRNCSKQRN